MTDGLNYITREINELKTKSNLSLSDVQLYIDRTLGVAIKNFKNSNNSASVPMISDSLIEMYKAASEAVIPEHKELVLSPIIYWEIVSIRRKIK